jgi:hypothetical protein
MILLCLVREIIRELLRKEHQCEVTPSYLSLRLLSDNKVLMMMMVERVYCSVCGAVS